MRAWGILVISLVALVWAGAVAHAHGGGTVRAVWPATGFNMVIETDETPSSGAFGGTVHVTLIPTPSGSDSLVRLRNLSIEVLGVGPNGASAGPTKAAQTLNGAYEADLMVPVSGDWSFHLRVGEGEGAQTFAFPLSVAARSWWADVGVVGGLMAIPVLALVGMARKAQRNVSRRRPVSDRSPAVQGEGGDAV